MRQGTRDQTRHEYAAGSASSFRYFRGRYRHRRPRNLRPFKSASSAMAGKCEFKFDNEIDSELYEQQINIVVKSEFNILENIICFVNIQTSSTASKTSSTVPITSTSSRTSSVSSTSRTSSTVPITSTSSRTSSASSTSKTSSAVPITSTSLRTSSASSTTSRQHRQQLHRPRH